MADYQYGPADSYANNTLSPLVFDQRALPTFSKPQPNALMAGLSSGVDDLQGLGGSALQAAGKLTGWQGLEGLGKGIADRNALESKANGREDLDNAPWRDGGGGWGAALPWLAYQAGKQIPQVAGAIAGGMLLPEAAVPAGLARLGAMLPRAIGGGAGLGAEEAAVAGGSWAKSAAGAFVPSYPIAVGSMYQQATEREAAGGGAADQGDALKAFGLGVPYAALDTLEPAFLHHMAAKGATGNIAKRFATGALAGSLQEMPVEALQTAMENSFRPDMTTQQKMDNIVDAAITGGAVGGMFGGGLASLRKAKSAHPTALSNEDISAAVDEATQLALPAPTPGDPRTATGSGAPIMLPNETERYASSPYAEQERGRAQAELDATDQQQRAEQQQQADQEARTRAPADIASVFNGSSDDELKSALTTAQTAIAKGNQSTNLLQRMRLLQTEMDRRTEGREATSTQPPSLFSEDDFTQKRAPDAPAAANPADAMRARAKELAGGTSAWIKKLDVKDDAGLLDHVLTRLENGASDAKTMTLGTKLGIISEDGNERDLPTELAAAREKVVAAKADAVVDPTQAGQAETHAANAAEIEQQHNLLQEVLQRRAGVAADPQAQSESANPLGAPTEPASNPEQPSLSMAFGNTETAPAAPQTFGQTRDFLAGIVGKVNPVLRNLDAKNVPEAVSATASYMAGTKRPNQTMTKIAEHFGLIENGKPVTIPDAIEKTQTALQAVTQKINALPANDAAASRTLAPQAAQLQERLDALQSAHATRTQAETSPATAVKADPAATSTLTQTDQENIAATAATQRQQLADIRDNKQLPPSLRRDATAAAAAIRNNAPDANEKAGHVLAAHEALTGNVQAQSTGALTSNTTEGYADGHARDLGGEVVHSDADGALIRARAVNGNTVYAAVSPPTDTRPSQRTMRDVDSYTGDMFSSRVLQKLRDAKAIAHAEETVNAQAMPDGPFTGKTGNVAASKGVSEKASGLLSDWMQQLGMGNARVFLFHPEDIHDHTERGKYGLFGDYYRAMQAGRMQGEDGQAGNFGKNGHDFYISLNSAQSEHEQVETLGHELGHIIKWTALANADENTKAAIEKGYQEWLVKTGKMTAPELVTALRNQATGARQSATMNDQTRLQNSYWKGRDEYFADNVSKYMTSDRQAVGAVEKFFKSVGGMLRKLMDLYQNGWAKQGDLKPAEAVAKFLDGMKTSDPLVWNEMSKVSLKDAFSTAAPGLSPQNANEQVQHLMQSATGALEKMKQVRDWSSKGFRLALGAFTNDHIALQYKRLFPETGSLILAHEHRTNVSTRLSQLFSHVNDAYEVLPQASQEKIQKLMQFAGFGIDGRKGWSEHEHLHDLDNPGLQRKFVEEANKSWNELGKIPGAQKAYQQLAKLNSMHNNLQHSIQLHQLIQNDPKLAARVTSTDPVDGYLAQTGLHEDIDAASKYWGDTLASQLEGAKAYLREETGAYKTSTSEAEKSRISSRISPLQQEVMLADKSLKGQKEAPYFHLGRSGNYFVSFKMKALGEGALEGRVDQRSREIIAEAMAKAGFGDVTLSDMSDKRSVFARVETQTQADGLMKVIAELQAKGHTSEIIKGLRDENTPGQRIHPEFIDGMIARLQADFGDITKGADPETTAAARKTLEQTIATMRQHALNMMPDTALAKVMTERRMIPGFSSDMMRSYAARQQLSINAIAGISAQPRVNAALKDMRTHIQQAKTDPNTSLSDTIKKQHIFAEMMTREGVRPQTMGRDLGDTIRSINHNYFLSLNPAYVLTNMTQVGTMLWPELGSKHGFVKSAKVIAQVTPLAMRIVAAQIKHGWSKGVHRIGDGTITEQVLNDAKLTPAQKSFVTNLINTGVIDLGSAGREIGQLAQGTTDSKTAAAMRMASAAGVYSETFNRLVSGFAARELHGSEKEGSVEYAKHVIKETMFNYTSTNVARFAGKAGVFGRATPVATSFMQYQFQLMEKLWRTISTGFLDKAATAEEKSQARKFLGGHMAAMTVLAGTLGTPAASLFARVAEATHDLFEDKDDEPWDAKAAYRNWLSGFLGKDAGEVIARGLPRAFGFDMSGRAGEQDLLPFTKILTDRRKWEDVSKDLATGTLGAPFSMASNIILGGRDIMQGNILQGLREALPTALKSGATAYDMSQNGYHDKTGQTLPLASPGTGAIMSQLLGFNPAEKAEYTEANQTQTARKGQLVRAGTNIRQNLANAIESGDEEGRATAMEQARSFDQHNPGFAILPRLAHTLSLRAKARSLAETMGTPLGVKPKDRAAPQLTDFANY